MYTHIDLINIYTLNFEIMVKNDMRSLGLTSVDALESWTACHAYWNEWS